MNFLETRKSSAFVLTAMCCSTFTDTFIYGMVRFKHEYGERKCAYYTQIVPILPYILVSNGITSSESSIDILKVWQTIYVLTRTQFNDGHPFCLQLTAQRYWLGLVGSLNSLDIRVLAYHEQHSSVLSVTAFNLASILCFLAILQLPYQLRFFFSGTHLLSSSLLASFKDYLVPSSAF